jgi:DNA gyrase subunit A
MFKLLVDNVPVGTNVSKGIKVNTIINMEADEKVIAITSLHRESNAEYVVFFTKKGLVKKTKLEEYMKVKRSTGIAAINLKEGDSLANVTFLNDEEVVVITRKGMSIHFSTADIGAIGRVTAGVKSIKLMDDDEVVVGLPIHKETDKVAIFTSKGYAKQCVLDEFPYQGRGGKGVVAYKPTQITGNIAGAAMIDEKDNILLVGTPNSICISSKDIPLLSRVSTGNIMIKGKVNSIVKL